MIDLNDYGTIEKIIGEIESQENIDRKQNEYQAELVYDGLQKNFVEKKLKEMYPKTWHLYTKSDYNIFKKIVAKLSKAYKTQPKRKLSNPELSTKYDEFLYLGDYQEVIKQAEKIYNKHRYGLMGFFPSEVNGMSAPKFVAIPPYQYDVIKDEYGNLECVVLSYQPESIQEIEEGNFRDELIASNKHEEGADQRVYSFWTKDMHAVITKKKNKDDRKTYLEWVQLPNNPNNINPLGVMNFIEIPKTTNYPRNNTLSSNSIELNTLLSVYYTSANMQIGQMVVSYPADKKMDTVVHGLMSVLNLPQSTNPNDPVTDARYISPSPNLAGHKEAIVLMMNTILDEYGITSNTAVTDTQNYTSGFDRLLSNADVQDYVEETQELFTKVEYFFFDTLNEIYSNAFGRDFNVIYAKPKVLITDTEKLTNIEKAYSLGLIEEHEKLQIYDPNLSEAEAKDKLARIKEQRQESMDRVLNGLQSEADRSDIQGQS